MKKIKILFLLVCALFTKQLHASFNKERLEKKIEYLDPVLQRLSRITFVIQVNPQMKKTESGQSEIIDTILGNFKIAGTYRKKMQIIKKQKYLRRSKIKKNRLHIR